MRFAFLPLAAAWLAAFAAGSTAQTIIVPDVPAALRPPADQVAYLEALATGVQIYECSQKADSTYEWAFKAPEATLATRNGQMPTSA